MDNTELMLLSDDELYVITGGIKWDFVLSSVIFVSVGVGCCAIACVPGVNVVAAAALAVGGVHIGIGGTFCGVYGLAS